MTDSYDRVLAKLTAEQVALLAAHGAPIDPPHRSTRLRREARDGRVFPVVSRSGRSYREATGRIYGEVSPAQQRQADAGYWRVGTAVRDACEPMTVAVAGKVERIYEVRGWIRDSASGKWVADLGRRLTNDELDRLYPEYPYREGHECPTRRGGAYRPETY